MNKYDHQKIEEKWQKKWEEEKLYEAKDFDERQKFYCLDMFPYPSGEGLHVGHWRGYVLSDLMARFQMLKGKNILHPMGWDAFGLPAENAAIKNKSHPKIYTDKAIANFRRQLKQIGSSFDWSREINTSDPSYYKWTEWLFLKLYENDLAYRKKAPVNWCPNCQTVLANEQVVSGECERCGGKVTKKELTQWFFRITKFADDLLEGLDNLDWPERTKNLQRNWIGKSEGSKINFKIQISNSKSNSKSKEQIDNYSIEVFTTRTDTLFGCTYVVLAPEHEMINKIVGQISNIKEVEDYIASTKQKSDLERTEENKVKTGVKLEGITAINPINNKEVPVFIADYVLKNYGTGAVMAVPAHDERDFDFAKKYNLPITQVIAPFFTTNKGQDAVRSDKNTVHRKMVAVVIKHWAENKIMCLEWPKFNWGSFILGGIDEGESGEQAALREMEEETGYYEVKNIQKFGFETHSNFFAGHKDENRYSESDCFVITLASGAQKEVSPEHTKNHQAKWVEHDKVSEFINLPNNVYYWDIIQNGEKAFVDYGVLINSGEFNGLKSKEALQKITEKLKKDKAGDFSVNYKLRDWLISRQRYWGAPIPIIYCDKCGEVPVPEKDLPVLLPEDVAFTPHGDSPLKKSKTFIETTCPKCGGAACRETDTMDTFVDSSWYYLAYTMRGNSKSEARNSKKDEDIFIENRKELDYWMPVDLYIGGVEHAILHLLYARFISYALHDLNILDDSIGTEPFKKLFNIGMVYLHGSKMSKSKGNIVSPDDLISKYGTDALRGYELFVGPADLDSEWQVNGITGIYRFIEKIWQFYENIKFDENQPPDPRIEEIISIVTFEIQAIRPNTALSHLMGLFNYLKHNKTISKSYADKIITLVSPFFPHLGEEIWQKLGHSQSIFQSTWPQFDASAINKTKSVIAIQINGKTRDVIEVDANLKEDEIVTLAKKRDKISAEFAGKNVLKVIYVAGKVISFVLE